MEILAVTLKLLQEQGFERLTVGDVAAVARASKATLYRRWKTKGELVLASVCAGFGPVAPAAETGTLRGDLLQCGQVICDHMRAHAGTIRAVLAEAAHSDALTVVLQQRLLDEPIAAMERILDRAAERGEIVDVVVAKEVRDVFSGYLTFRAALSMRTPDFLTVRTLVDEVVLPALSSSA
jgi:AcrR family transcriptional regulator